MADGFRYCDDLGPTKVVHMYEPAVGLRVIVVVDNVAAGPAIGGVRMAGDTGLDECFRLARSMTLKNAAAALAHGGGKAVILADPKQAAADKERLIRAFACAIRSLTDYIPGPDMGTDETCMAWVEDEIGRAVGLPPELGGIPLDRLGATGFGLAVAAEAAQAHAGIDLEGARVVVQGFGSVGRHAARFLAERGAILVAASDSRSAVIDDGGLDLDALIALKEEGGGVRDHPRGEKVERDAIIDVPCDIWIPAARPDVLRADNVDRLDAKLVLEGANIPATAEAEARLHERGVVVVPDFIANAGGVICAAMEYAGATETLAFEAIATKIRANTAEVLDIARKKNAQPRHAAVELAIRRVRTAMRYRRWS